MRQFINVWRVLLVAMLCGLLLSSVARADDPAPPVKIEKRQLLVQPKGERGQQVEFLADPVLWIQDRQRQFYGSMSGSLRQMRDQPFGPAALILMLLSLGYGIFHAAGPGHGKTVVAAWLLASGSELRRGVFVTFLSSIIQALSAIVIVSVVLFVISGAASTARMAADTLESASYLLISCLGLYLIWTALRPLLFAMTKRHHAHHHTHNHDHDHSHSQAHNHHHVHDEHCGHAHAPEPSALRQDWSLIRAVSMATAIGVRPCTGAILVLLAAYPLGLYWAGIMSVIAMSAGTFVTVSLIAAATVYFRHIALRFSSDRSYVWLERSLRMGAGVFVAGLGGLLFWASLGPGSTGG